MNKIRLIILICITSFFSKGLYGQEIDRWYTVSIGGQPAGYLLEKNDGNESQYNSLTEMNISFGRLGSKVKMQTKTLHIEKEGELISINSELHFSNEKKIESVLVMDDHLIIESQGFKRNLPLETKLTGPEKLAELLRQEIKNDRQSIYFTTFSAELGMYLNGKIDFTGTEKVKVNGMEFNAIVAEESIQELPYVKKKWLTKEGILLKSTEPSPFGDMEVIWTNMENALLALNNNVDLPEDHYGSSMAYSNYRLSHPRELSSIKIKITQKRPEFGFPDFSSEYQTILSQTDEEIIIQIDKPKLSHGHYELTELDEYLEPNTFLDNSDEMLIEKTNEVIGSETDDWEKVKLILEWVRKNMQFDAGIAFADSREVIRDMKGTCVSYAILTSAMSKAAGIPARFLMGYVYVDGAWGGHAWSEVHINGQWIPIDAAVPNNTHVADVARFSMDRSSLKIGLGKANIAGMQLFGNIDVDILEYSINGETYTATKEPYILKNDIYTNHGLRFIMKKLTGFEFSDLDLFYPENTILKQNNGASEIVVAHWAYGSPEEAMDIKKILQKRTNNSKQSHQFKIERYEGVKISGTDQTIAILRDGSTSFFTLTITGPSHRELLENALGAIY